MLLFPHLLSLFSGAQAIDEACEAARSICMTNANAAVFCMYPIPHTSLERSTCVGHRRVLEDRLMQPLDCVTRKCVLCCK